jgi:hypothetical protein
VDGTTISSGSSSKITLNESVDITGTLQVNDINSADSSAIQINDGVNVSGILTVNNTMAVNSVNGITTTATTFPIVNTTATTVSLAGASTTLNIANGLTGAVAQTVGIANGTNTGTKTIAIGTSGSTTNLTLGVAAGGTTTINSATVVGASATQALYNTTASTINFAGAATALNVGATTGTMTINNPTVVGSQTTQNLFSSRAANTTYTNSSGRPIMVYIRANITAVGNVVVLLVNNAVNNVGANAAAN